MGGQRPERSAEGAVLTYLRAPYHIGLVVQELEPAMRELSELLGLTWASVMQRSVLQETADEPQEVDLRLVYSLEGPPYLELLERREGTVYGTLGLHHLGLWSDSPEADSSVLAAARAPRETVVLNPDGTWSGGLYHRADCGLRLELVAIAASGPRLVRYLAGGSYE